MPLVRISCLFVLTLVGAVVLSLGAASAQGQGGLAIVGADILPMTGSDRLEDQTVLIAGDRIIRVGPAARVEVPAGFRVVDAQGLTLMPGLVDMHVHLAPEPGKPGDSAQRALAVMLGHGITTARGMAGSPSNLIVRDAIERGELAGPRFYAAAPGLHLQNTPDAEAARTAVRQAKEAGYDFIKSHHIADAATWEAAQDEAKRQGLATAGHVTNEVGLFRALAAGQQVEHLDGALMELLPAGAPERNLGFAQIPPPAVMLAVARASDAQLEALARKVAATGGYQVPTLALFESIVSLDAPTEELIRAPEMRFVPDGAIQQWATQRELLKASGLTTEQTRAFQDIRRRIVRAYAGAGVPIMAGSDTAQAFHIWGPGLIREIEALAAAGLSRMEALRSATVVPRDYLRSLPNGRSSLGWKPDFGTVEEGARADLILLKGDPSQDLGALRRLAAVIAGGKLYDRSALDAMLSQAAVDAKAGPPAAAAAATAGKQIYVMRHLDTGEGPDPGLSLQGTARAERLSDFLASHDIRAIYVTDTRRSRETAAPLAAKLGILPSLYDPRRPDALAAETRADTGNVLVIGHSNTVPDLVARFGGTPPAPLNAGDFGTLWRIDAGSGMTRSFSLDGPSPVSLGPCTGRNLHPSARCGSIKVSEDRTRAGGRMLDIHFAVIPASDAATDAPLVVLPGGPGLGGVQAGPGIEQTFGPMARDRDILLIDQRGTGRSNPLHCPRRAGDGGPLAGLSGRTPDEVKACRDALMKIADLGRYTTREAVLDMEAVRAALGYDKLDLFGMSYGSRVALDYLRLFPDRVGETVIRAAAPPSMKLPLWTPRDAQHSYDTLVRYCMEQADCAARHPGLTEDLHTILARLNDGPVSAVGIDPRDGTKIDIELNREGFSTILFFLLYIPEFYVQLPPLVERAAAGDFSPMLQAAAPVLVGTADQVAWGLRWSVICDEDVRRIDGVDIAGATDNTFMGAGIVHEDVSACSLWPRAPVAADYLAPVESGKPVLIISGAMDPVAGKVWGEDIARTLPGSVHVEVDGASHLPPLPGCTATLMQRFIDDEPLDSIDMDCVRDAKRPPLRVAA